MVLRRVAAGLLITIAALTAARTVKQKQPQATSKPKVDAAAARPAPKTTAKAAPGAPDKLWAQRTLKRLSLRDQIAQLIMITTYGEMPPSRTTAARQMTHWVRDLHVGGLIVVNKVVQGSVRNAEPYAMAAFLNRMQRMSKLPLLVGGDFERGASMRVAGTAKYPHMMAYGAAHDPGLTRALGVATAAEARALGVNWVFAPVADVNSNPDNPIINIRSFGEDPELVAANVKAFIEGAHSDRKQPVLVTVKHFPGHGDTNVDSHIGLANLPADRARMNTVELVPFKAAISAGVDSVMTAHMAVPAIEPQEIPATVSSNVLTGLLRKDLAFDGLIVTDAMDMQGLTTRFPGGEAAVRALEAGADMLLMPPNPDEVIRSVAAAIQSGRLTRKRIEASALKVLAAKARVGLHRSKLVDLDALSDLLESPEAEQQAQEAADRALTLVRNEGDALPLRKPDTTCTFILIENRYGQQGRRTLEEIQKRTKSMRNFLLDPLVPSSEIEQALTRSSGCTQHVVAAFVSASAYRGNVALPQTYMPLMEGLLKSGTPVTMISLGNPYLLRSFPSVSAYLATFSVAPTAEAAAVKAMFGEIPVTGKLPVSIPGLAKFGDGIQLNAVKAAATTAQN